MKIFAVKLFAPCSSTNATKECKASHVDVSHVNFFMRSTTREFINMTCHTLVERTAKGGRQSVAVNDTSDYMCHVHVRADGSTGCVITDKDYPSRVAYSLINKVLDDYTSQYEPTARLNPVQVGMLEEQLKQLMTKFQDPSSADSLTRVQRELDETKIILHKTIEGVLKRGEKVDSLVDRSAHLSAQSKGFYKAARKTNQCSCNLM